MTADRPDRSLTPPAGAASALVSASALEASAARVLRAVRERGEERRFLCLRLPSDLDPRVLVGRLGDRVLGSYERPSRGLALVGIGDAGAVTLERRERPSAARQRLEWLIGAPHDASVPFLRPRVFAAFAFDPDGSRSGPWAGFGSGLLRLPAMLLVQEAGEAGIVIAPGVDAAEVERLFEALAAAPAAEEPLVPHLRIAVDMSREAMHRSIEVIASEVRAGRYEKAVLAGQREVVAEAPIDIAAAVEALRADYPHCHVFTLGCEGATFLGASPELLVRLDRGVITSLGLAGSAPRGEDDEADRRLGQALLDSAKNRIEHEIVVRAVREALLPLCTELQAPNHPQLLRLRNIQHLATDVRARAASGVDLLELVDRLHPTPAVCGWPTEVAREVIADHETFDRGWYAGPVGWIDAAGEGEFAVALRSALVRDDRAWLFAGAGIMGDSRPDAELAEIDLKFRPLAGSLAGRSR